MHRPNALPHSFGPFFSSRKGTRVPKEDPTFSLGDAAKPQSQVWDQEHREPLQPSPRELSPCRVCPGCSENSLASTLSATSVYWASSMWQLKMRRRAGPMAPFPSSSSPLLLVLKSSFSLLMSLLWATACQASSPHFAKAIKFYQCLPPQSRTVFQHLLSWYILNKGSCYRAHLISFCPGPIALCLILFVKKTQGSEYY